MTIGPLTRAEVRDVDRRAIAEYGLPGIVLMENAGRNAAMLLQSVGPEGRVVIACGKGNNAGDGFVIARHLENLGRDVRLLLACRPEELTGDAAIQAAVAGRSGTPTTCLAGADEAAWEAALGGADWIVDALLGTGAHGAPRGTIAAAIRGINTVRAVGAARVFAVDLPSGLDCDTGAAPGDCIRADVTATFVARKLGFAAPGADRFTGQVHVIDIGVPRRLLAELERERGGRASRSPALGQGT